MIGSPESVAEPVVEGPTQNTTSRRLRRPLGPVAVDLIPEFHPIIGPLDGVVVVALALRYAARQVPRDVLFEAWPAEPRLLERLIGRAPLDGSNDP